MSEQCTALFAEVFSSHCCGCIRTCHCGITHFDTTNTWDWGDGELVEMLAKAKAAPAKYVESDGAVRCIEIAGIEIVEGCTCDTAAKYERFILAHAELLSEYLRKHAKELREHADKIDVPPETDNAG